MTGLKVPKGPTENLLWRAKLLSAAESDDGLQRDMYTAASLSILFWVNTFVFTHRKFTIGPDGKPRQCKTASDSHIPFVTWAVQDEHILLLEDAINQGYEVLTDKSRDMGATWDHIAAFHHQWMFHPDRSLLELSRKEDCVDQLDKAGEGASDPGTLLGKHDYINLFLPEWMKPAYTRKRMHLVNLVNRSRIDGESTNATAGSSDRRTAILLDEMAKMKEGAAIKRSTRDVTACRLANSTPNGAGTEFSKWRLSGQVKVMVLPWWEHPEKGVGRHAVQDKTTGQWKITAPWYNHEAEIRTPREMAIEIDMDHIGSGETFFENYNLEVHKTLFACPPRSRWKIDFQDDIAEKAISKLIRVRDRKTIVRRREAEGPLQIWYSLLRGRLDQTRNYVIGCDISRGQGASNSVASIYCAETSEKVGEWADANTPPYEFARIAVALCLWVGGARNNGLPLLIWEQQGPGWDFGRQVVKVYNYPIFYSDKQVGTTTDKKSKKYGWHSTRDKKAEALGILRRAYAHGGFINHSELALEEAKTYVYYDGGGLGPASLSEENEQARKTHGDRVIADMLCLVGSQDVPVQKLRNPDKPLRSIGGRKRKWMERRKGRRSKRRFDFREDY